MSNPTPTTPPTPTPPAKTGMPLADIRLKIDKNGSDVPVSGVTPAELQLLVAEHHANAGGDPVLELKETGTSTRTDREELGRLLSKYPNRKVNAMYQVSNLKYPTTFQDARQIGVTINLPAGKMLEHNLLGS